MPTVKLTVNDKVYEVICQDGEEAHLTQLAGYIDEKSKSLGLSVSQAGEARLLLLVGLLITDELFDARSKIGNLETRLDSENAESLEDETGRLILEAARKIVDVTKKIEQATAQDVSGKSS